MRNRTISAIVLCVAIAMRSHAAKVDFLHLLLTRPTPTFLAGGSLSAREDEQNETGLQQSLDWERLTLLDEHGRFNARGLYEANLHRQQHLPPHSITGFTATAETLKPVGQTLNWYNWISRGPINIGGRTRALLVLPTNSQVIYAGAASGGVWITNNGGTSWSPLTDLWANLTISSLAFDGLNTSTIYAGTGESSSYYDAIGGIGILKSTDGGFNWTSLTATTGFTAVRVLAAQPNASGVILAGTDTGIYRTNDGGTTWAKVYPSGANTMRIWSISFDPNDATGNSVIAAAGNPGPRTALYSSDAGMTFNVAMVPADPGGSELYVQYARSSPSTVYMYRVPNQILKSTGGGSSYTLVATQSTSFTQYGDTSALWVSPTNPSLLVIGGLDLWRSADGGVSFTRISNSNFEVPGGPEPHADQHVIVSDPNNSSVVYFGNDGGVYKTVDINAVYSQSNYWVNLNRTYQTTQFYNAAGNASGIGIYFGGLQDNGSVLTSPTTVFSPFRGANEGQHVSCCDGGWVAIDPVNTNYLHSEAQGLSPSRSTDGGYTSFYSGIGIDDHTGNFITPMIMDPNNPATLMAGGAQLWRTTSANTNSETWTSIRPASSQLAGIPQAPYISAIAIAPGNSNIVWVGLDDGRVEKTLNGTATTPTWTVIDNGTSINPLPQRYILSIYIDPANANVVYVTLGGYSTGNVWRTADGGATWSNIHGLLPAIPIRTIVRHPRNSQQLYVGGDVGVYTSSDGGQNWITSEEGPADVAVHSLNFVAGSELLLAGTHGRGMWTADVSDVPTLAPSGLVATANGTSSIVLYWTSVAGASSYQVWRSSDGAPYSVVATVTNTPGTTFYTDTNVVAGKTYLYKTNTTINSVPTAYSNVDLATTVTFSFDNQLFGRIILASYLQEIRNATNMVRAAAGLSPLTFSPAAAPGVLIQATDITSLRSGLNAAYTAIGMPAPPVFTEFIGANVFVKASHFQEIRNAVK